MFIREKKSKDKSVSVIQLVENRRVGSTTKQQVLQHIGTAHTPEAIIQLKQLAQVVKARLEKEASSKHQQTASPEFATGLQKRIIPQESTLVDITQLKETERRILGIHDVYGFIYARLGFSNLFTRAHQREEAAKVLREIVLARIAYPKSKRASVALLEEQFGVTVNLDHVYQMMDKIDAQFCERVQHHALSEAINVLGGKVSVLFYDATTLYFESFIEDELKQNGYSKDMKFNQSQVILTLFVTENGLPIGYDLFSGGTFEGHTLIPALEKLKERYQLTEVVFVADRGLLSKKNLAILEAHKFKYIVGARIKGLSKELKELILNRENYKNIEIKWNTNKKKKEKNEVQRIAVFDEKKGRKLIVHYHSLRARKDENDRKKSVEKLYKKLSKSKNPKELLNNYGYKKYVEVEGRSKLVINELKIKEASQWDGLLGIVTNINDSSPEILLRHYRGLWQVEESFRINKHDLRMRPIYHWNPKRVKAHIAISFMAFVCVRYLEYLVSVRWRKISPEVVKKALLQVQASIVEDTASGRRFLLASSISEEAKRIYALLDIKVPKRSIEICGA